MTGKGRHIEAGGLGGALDDAGGRIGRQARLAESVAERDRPEHRTARNRGRVEPRPQRGDRAQAGAAQ